MSDLFICFSGDSLDNKANIATISDDVEEARRINQAINLGNEIWRSYYTRVGGSVVEMAGDTGSVQVPVDAIPELKPIVDQYSEAIETRVSVGVGTKLSEANKALKVAKLRGGDRIIFFNDEMQKELDNAKEEKEYAVDKLAEGVAKSEEVEKITDPSSDLQTRISNRTRVETHGVKKSEPLNKGYMHNNAPQAPEQGQEDHEEAATVNNEIEEANENVIPVEKTHSMDGAEELYHAVAQAQQKKDDEESNTKEDNRSQIKNQVAGVLKLVQAQAPVIAQMKQAAPQTFDAVMQLVQSVIALGRELSTPGDMKKGEVLKKAIANIPPGKPINDSPFLDYSHVLPKGTKGLQLLVGGYTPGNYQAVLRHPTEGQVGQVVGLVSKKSGPPGTPTKQELEPHSSLNKEYHGKGLGTAMYEGLYAHAKANGINTVHGGMHTEAAHRVHQSLAKKHGFKIKNYEEPDEDLDYPHGHYAYTIKDELPADANIDNEIIGPGKGVHFVQEHKDKLPGGAADKMQPWQFAPEELQEGMSHEMEHTTDPSIAREIAMDHLTEDSQYYTHMKQVGMDKSELKKDISSIEPGKRYSSDVKGNPLYDYSHLIPEEHRHMGLAITVKADKDGGFMKATVHPKYESNKPLGEVVGLIDKGPTGTKDLEPHSELDPSLRGKGIGAALYESLYSHAKQNGVTNVVGGPHTAAAHKVHERLAAKHGFQITNAPTSNTGKKPAFYGNYSYALKAETPANEDDTLFGPGRGIVFRKEAKTEVEGDRDPSTGAVLDKGALAAHHETTLPVGSTNNGRIKVQHGPASGGKTSWKSVRAGMVQSQDGDSALFGANSHPTSSRNPSGK